MNYEEILSRIQKGENIEDIANEFTAVLNKAQAEVAAKEAAETKSKKIEEIAATMTDALNEYVALSGVEMQALEVKDVRNLLDSYLPLIEAMKDFKIHIAKTPCKKMKKNNSPEDIFAAFFKDNGWF